MELRLGLWLHVLLLYNALSCNPGMVAANVLVDKRNQYSTLSGACAVQQPDRRATIPTVQYSNRTVQQPDSMATGQYENRRWVAPLYCC